MLDLAGCTPWPTNRFRHCSILALGLVVIENFYHLLLLLEDILYISSKIHSAPAQPHVTARSLESHYLETLILSSFSDSPEFLGYQRWVSAEEAQDEGQTRAGGPMGRRKKRAQSHRHAPSHGQVVRSPPPDHPGT